MALLQPLVEEEDLEELAAAEAEVAELKRRMAWIQYYLKRGDNDKALALGWDGTTTLEEMQASSPIMQSPTL